MLHDEGPDGEDVPYHPKLREVQKYLWDCYTKDLNNVKRLVGHDPIVIIHSGDITHGDKYPSGLVTTREADQPIIATWNMKPWLELPGLRSVRIMFGTEAHSLGEGSAEILIVNALRALRPDVSIKARRHGLFTVGGARFDVAHHGAYPGSRTWLKGNVARYWLRDRMMQEILAGRQPPDVYLTAHYHELVHEVVEIRGERVWRSELYILPSYCGLTEFAEQVSKGQYLVTNGLLLFEIREAQIMDRHEMCRVMDLRTEEAL